MKFDFSDEVGSMSTLWKLLSYRMPISYPKDSFQLRGRYDQWFRLRFSPSVIQDKDFHIYTIDG